MIEKEEEQKLQETAIQGPGQILRQARERANLSSQDIADRMKLKKALIEDIEQDNYDINLSLTFVRGYLKLYAKHVQVGEAEIITAFESLSTQKKEPVKLQSFSRRVANQANDDKLMLVTYLIVAAVIALVVVWWFQQSSTDNTTASKTSNYPEAVTPHIVGEADLPVEKVLPIEDTQSVIDDSSTSSIIKDTDALIDDVDFDAETPAIALIPVVEKQVINNQSVDSDVVDDTSSSLIVENDMQTPVTELAAPVKLLFEFSGDCWMNLSDATGENIAYGVKVKGRVMPVTGIPPFVVTLGAPEVVNIRYAGESLDMSFLPAGRIAKFDLPLSEKVSE